MTQNELKPYVIGLDLGGTNSVFGIVDSRGEIKATTAIKTGGYDKVDDYVKAAVEALTEGIRTSQVSEHSDSCDKSPPAFSAKMPPPLTARGTARGGLETDKFLLQTLAGFDFIEFGFDLRVGFCREQGNDDDHDHAEDKRGCNVIEYGLCAVSLKLHIVTELLAFTLLSAFIKIFQWWGMKIQNIASKKVLKYLNNLIFEKAKDLDVSCYEDPAFYDKYQRATLVLTNGFFSLICFDFAALLADIVTLICVITTVAVINPFYFGESCITRLR